MTEHNALGVSSSATRVDERAALARSLLLDIRLNGAVLDVLAELEELAEGIHTLILLKFLRENVDTVNDESLETDDLVSHIEIHLEVLDSLDDDALSARVLRLV